MQLAKAFQLNFRAERTLQHFHVPHSSITKKIMQAKLQRCYAVEGIVCYTVEYSILLGNQQDVVKWQGDRKTTFCQNDINEYFI